MQDYARLSCRAAAAASRERSSHRDCPTTPHPVGFADTFHPTRGKEGAFADGDSSIGSRRRPRDPVNAMVPRRGGWRLAVRARKREETASMDPVALAHRQQDPARSAAIRDFDGIGLNDHGRLRFFSTRSRTGLGLRHRRRHRRAFSGRIPLAIVALFGAIAKKVRLIHREVEAAGAKRCVGLLPDFVINLATGRETMEELSLVRLPPRFLCMLIGVPPRRSPAAHRGLLPLFRILLPMPT